jgi:hypothetical protein
MGPMAEDAVLGILNESDVPECIEAACQVLSAIGTQKSLPELEACLENPTPSVQQAAREALDAIQRREGE